MRAEHLLVYQCCLVGNFPRETCGSVWRRSLGCHNQEVMLASGSLLVTGGVAEYSVVITARRILFCANCNF